jgi:hypothetical protein
MYILGIGLLKISGLNEETRERLFKILESEHGKGNNFAKEYYKLCEEQGEVVGNEYLERVYNTFMNIVDCFYKGDSLEDGLQNKTNNLLEDGKSKPKFFSIEEGDFTVIEEQE